MPTLTRDGISPRVDKERREITWGCRAYVSATATPIPGLDKLRGRILEVGFGCGDAHYALHGNPDVTSIHIIERFPEITEAFMECNCPLTIADAMYGPPQSIHGHFDAIILDVWPDLPDPTPWKELVAPGGVLVQRHEDAQGLFLYTWKNDGSSSE